MKYLKKDILVLPIGSTTQDLLELLSGHEVIKAITLSNLENEVVSETLFVRQQLRSLSLTPYQSITLDLNGMKACDFDIEGSSTTQIIIHT